MKTLLGNVVEAHFFLDPNVDFDCLERFIEMCFGQSLSGNPIKVVVRFYDQTGWVTLLTQLLVAEEEFLERIAEKVFATSGWRRRLLSKKYSFFLRAKLVTEVIGKWFVIKRLQAITSYDEIALEHNDHSFHFVQREGKCSLFELLQESKGGIWLIVFASHQDLLAGENVLICAYTV